MSKNALRCAPSRYGVVIASTHGKLPAPTVSAMNHAWSTVSSTALGDESIDTALAAPLGGFGPIAGHHRHRVGFVGAGHRLVGTHHVFHGLVPLHLPGLIRHPGVTLPGILQCGLLGGDIGT